MNNVVHIGYYQMDKVDLKKDNWNYIPKTKWTKKEYQKAYMELLSMSKHNKHNYE